jgi:3D (Asp-Asp-Asp) domain-containing protein
MNTKQTMITTGIILTLLGSNVVLGEKYILDKNTLEKKIHKQSELIEQKESDKSKLNDEIKLQSSQNDILLNEINKSFQQVNKLKKENATLKKDNIKLKKQWNERKEVNKQYFDVTAYTAGYESTQKSKGDIGYGITASGTRVKEGRTIACPPSLKFGTKLNIDKIGIRVCEDRGGAIKSGHLDLYMDSLNEALDFGRKKLSVEILN